MRRRAAPIGIVLLLVLSGCTLRKMATDAGIFIGTAITPAALAEPQYAAILEREFSSLTPENEMKWSVIHPAPDVYDFTQADALVELAETRNMRVRGHTLAWHQQNPAWLTGTAWTRDEAIALLEEHITTVVGRYAGRIAQWDVVNEAWRADQHQRNPWLDAIGPAYIDMAFELAHAADPNAELYYNDFSLEWHSLKSDAVFDMVSSMVARGIPIHGVGMQMHITATGANAFDAADAAALATQIARYEPLGIDVELTEMDVRMQLPVDDAKLAAQADAYRLAAETCLAAPNCTGITVWGFSDAHSWVPSTFAGWGAALLWDESYQAKPALGALRGALAAGAG